MFSINNISVSYSGSTLFKNATFIINGNDRIGLIGKNGSGKTTLLRIIVGQQQAESGEVVIPYDKTVGYLPQEMRLENSNSVFNEAIEAFSEIKKLEEEIRLLSDEVTHRTDFESRDYHTLINQLTESNEKYNILGGHTIEAETEKVLQGLGFANSDYSRPLNEFSYGWQMRVELAKILLRKPNLILLDEPTNHLDIESIQWLEHFLINYQGAVILVSHDRAFLDNITNKTVEIELGKIYNYKAPYSEYVFLREQRLERQKATFNNQQRQIRQIERFIERFRYKNTKSRQVQSRIKMLEKIEDVEIEDFDYSAIHFSFPPAQSSGKVVVNAKDLIKKYGANLVLNKLNFDIIKGDRVAFVGKNGEGKTTLSKIIARLIDFEGDLQLGYNVQLGYFAQNQNETLDPELTVFDTIEHIAVGDIRSRIRAILGAFLFEGDDIDKKVKVLSGGEKSRLALAKLLVSPANLLVLDEPTNHLDMRSKDILKTALLKYSGTLIVVSHDRDFLQGLTNKVFEFRNNKIDEYLGDIYDFLESRKLRTLNQLEVKAAESERSAKRTGSSTHKLMYEQKKQLDKEIRKVNSNIMACEQEISSLEIKLKELDQVLSEPDRFADKIASDEIFKNYDEIRRKLDLQMKNWEKMHISLEALNKKKSDLDNGSD